MLSADELALLLPAARRQQFQQVSAIEVAKVKVAAGWIRLLELADGRMVIAPTSDGTHRALAGDGVSTAVWEMPEMDGFAWDRFDVFSAGDETPVTVDQTNESVILGGKAVIKWQLLAEESAAAIKELRLHQAGFSATPALLGHLWWTDRDGVKRLVASVVEFVPDSTDGWTWCPDAIRSGDTTWAARLGVIIAEMHHAFAAAHIDPDRPQLVHGDLHVGQVLRAGNDFFVIDFDGDPLQTAYQKMALQSPLLDVASMLCSFTHAGMVAIKNGSDKVHVYDAIEQSHRTFLESYFREAQIEADAELHRRVID